MSETPILEIINTLKNLNDELETPDFIHPDKISVVERGVQMLLGMTYHMADGAGVSIEAFFQNPSFDDFMNEYARFCFHKVKRELDEIEVQTTLENLHPSKNTGFKRGIKILKATVDNQLEFIKWLKSKGLYNQMEPASIMQKMYQVWHAAKKE